VYVKHNPEKNNDKNFLAAEWPVLEIEEGGEGGHGGGGGGGKNKKKNKWVKKREK